MIARCADGDVCLWFEMGEEPQKPILRYLRAIDVKVDGFAADMSELKTGVPTARSLPLRAGEVPAPT
jgi:hypothetical protein